ncbi:MAG: DUF711 family protein [Pelolinea sp.]|nr:DUF711 family protein [Pelolinea sp.]
MKIRSITCFCNPLDKDFESMLNRLATLANSCKEGFEKKGWEVQTLRLATIPFGQYTTAQNVIQKITNLESSAQALGFTYLSVGPARLSTLEDYGLITGILKATRNVFITGMLAHPQRGISMQAVKACARVITEAATITPDGFTNLRFCAMSHVQPFTPFFPAAYSYGTQFAFALAMEAADAAIDGFKDAKDISEGRNKMLSHMEDSADELSKIAKLNAREAGISFKGFDFSLAPFPEDWCSIGCALENLGIPQLGFMGTLTAAAILAEALDQGNWQHVGFNGLMLPVLEDSTLAARTSSEHFTIKDLLMVSAVCGTGLDTVPLPGDISTEEIEPLLMDIAALSLRLRKPLTARLMPVPGLKAGDMTAYNFEFFKNGKVMDYPAGKIGGALAQSDWVKIRKREANF